MRIRIVPFMLLQGYCLLFFQAKASTDTLQLDSGKVGSASVIGLYGQFQLSSTGVNNKLLVPLIFGRKIDETAKEKIIANTQENNLLGGDYKVGLSYVFEKKAGLAFGFQVEECVHFHSILSKSVYEVLLRGNSVVRAVEGYNQKVDFFRYQKIGLHFEKNWNKTVSNIVKLNFLAPQSRFKTHMDYFSLNTSEYGHQLDMEIRNGVFTMSDTGLTSYSNFSGYGASIDLSFDFNLANDSAGINRFRVKMEDVGFLSWKEGHQFNLDTSIAFIGTNLNDKNDTAFAYNVWNDFDNELVSRSRQILPFWLHVNYQKEIGKNLLEAGISTRFFADYKPYMYLQNTFLLSNCFDLSGRLSYGGYSGFNLGIDAVYHAKKIEILLGSRNFESWVLPNKFGGVGLYFGLLIRIE